MLILLLILISLILPSPAQAYLDPGTGSYVLQLVVGGLLGLAFLLKSYWRKLSEIFKKKPDAKTHN